MAKDNGSNKHSKEGNDLLNGMKLEHQDNNIELLEYIRKQAGMYRE